MNTKIRLQAKYLLSQNTFRLFAVSFFSFCIRLSLLIFSVSGILFFINSLFIKNLTDLYGSLMVTVIYFLIYFIILFLISLFSAGIKSGEDFIYFTRSQGAKGSFTLLFKYLSPKKAFRALRFYAYVNFFKIIWLLYFSVPCAICTICDIYVYSYSASSSIHLILSVSISLLLSLSLIMWRISVARYSAAAYYFCLNPKIKVKEAVRKSIRFTDGFLTESVLLEYSLIGWFLSCIFVIPVFYVVPYAKLCKRVFVSEMLLKENRSEKSHSAITYLHSLSEHIN